MSATAPTATQNPADLVHGVKSFIRFTPTGGTAVEILTLLVDYDGKLETIKNMIPGADGVLRPNKENVKSSEDIFTIEIMEIKKGFTVLGGLNKLVKGTVNGLWIYDPDDVAGHCKILIPAFAASLKRTGKVSFSHDAFAKMQFEINNLSGAEIVPVFDGVDPV